MFFGASPGEITCHAAHRNAHYSLETGLHERQRPNLERHCRLVCARKLLFYFPMSEIDYDALIIGGGPGGSTAASYLAKAGRRVLVLEKERFPRFHIGESLLPYNRRIFDEIGVLPKLEAAGWQQSSLPLFPQWTLHARTDGFPGGAFHV